MLIGLINRIVSGYLTPHADGAERPFPAQPQSVSWEGELRNDLEQ